VILKRGRPVVAGNGPKPWLALRGTGRFKGDPCEPVLKETEIDALK